MPDINAEEPRKVCQLGLDTISSPSFGTTKLCSGYLNFIYSSNLRPCDQLRDPRWACWRALLGPFALKDEQKELLRAVLRFQLRGTLWYY